MNNLWQFIAGTMLASALALIGRRAALLTAGGQGILTIGVVAIWALRGWSWGITIALIILASGLAMGYRRKHKTSLLDITWGHPLDARAVGARVGWPLMLALLSAISNVDYYAAYTGSLATVCADVWASELGILSTELPRSLTSGRRARHGAPGAISVLGTMAAAGAAGLSGFVALLVFSVYVALDRTVVRAGMLWLPLAALLGGVVGVVVDSFLGSAAQGVYYCDDCDAYSEAPIHTCGARARQVRGWSWMTNEAIDTASSVVGAGVAAATVGLLGHL